MEPKMARRIHEDQASENQTVQKASVQSGFCADTIILTMDGELLARDIAPGDRIITRDAGMVKLLGVRRKRVVCDAVCIKADSLGHTRPAEEDGEFIKVMEKQSLEIVEFIFDTPHILYAGGLEVRCQTGE